ncbi:translation initiation factor IF-2 [Desulfovibrio sp.]|uniref:translation initiation factor IF-2 n=1 Tax=Desulfovibrio sp. TaxID=885 RepID=UPI0023D33B18|nr:translation initiation factor IF-2 [Desulfovibrio sp.]MDE7241755.1 translation initiation factor IF-2 [Desulfovibrio sp.]
MVGGNALQLAGLTAQAITPDQILPYVRAVSGLESRLCGGCALHHGGGQAVLVAYPAGKPDDMAATDAAVAEALALPGLERITVIAAGRPAAAPATAESTEDAYWALPLPLVAPPGRPGQKIRNLVRRAARDITIVQTGGPAAWTPDHAALAETFIEKKGDSLDAGSSYIFRKLGEYLAAAPDARLFSARALSGRLLACAIGDFSSFTTAFYMFAFRAQDAPPGTADALLSALAAEGAARGQALLNLGLGMGAGVSFFKKKWGATPFLPCVETSWTPEPPKKPGWLSRIFGR